MSTSKEYKAVRNYILNELHLTKEDIIKNIESLLEKLVKQCMLNTYGGNKPRNLLSMIRFQKKMNFMKVLRMKKKLKKNPANGI